jgi:hypothetical protein
MKCFLGLVWLDAAELAMGAAFQVSRVMESSSHPPLAQAWVFADSRCRLRKAVSCFPAAIFAQGGEELYPHRTPLLTRSPEDKGRHASDEACDGPERGG